MGEPIEGYRQSCSATIAASPEVCFAVITDFASYPRWASAVRQAQVLDSDETGLPRRVAFELDAVVKTLRYVLSYEYEAPREVRWRLVEGDVKAVEGSYRFEPTGEGTTRATCTQAVELGFWVPGPLKRAFERKALADSVAEFKREAEARAAVAPRARNR